MLITTLDNPPDWMSLDDARRCVSEELHGFLDRAATVPACEEQPALALRVSAGVGKTDGALRVLAARGRELLKGGHVLVFVPSHDLAEQAHEDFERFSAELPSMVLRGRGATNPATDAPMCGKADLASRISRIVGSVKDGLCETKDFLGKRRKASCRDACAYFAQLPRQNSVVFLSHSYLRSGVPLAGDVSLRIIDEKCLGQLTYSQGLSIEDWLEVGAPPVGAELDKARGTVFDALRAGAPVIRALRDKGFDKISMKRFAQDERRGRQALEIRPWSPVNQQEKQIEAFDLAALQASRGRAAIWSLLATVWDQDCTERLTLDVVGSGEGGATCSSIRRHGRRDLPRDAPLVLLDADADPVITEAIAPGARFVRVDVKPVANVVQINDRTFSTSSMIAGADAKAMRAGVLSVVEREAAKAPNGALLIATRKVLRQLQQDESPGGDHASDEALLRPLRGAVPRWFGPRLQGVNDYKNFDTAIVIGRLEPGVAAIEDQMRALFGDGDAPLQLLKHSAGACGWFPAGQGAYLTDRDEFVPAATRQHPDPRGAAILSLNREAHTIQALARLRAVGAKSPKRIILVSSVPLPGVPVNCLTSWKALVANRPAIELSSKFKCLEKAMFSACGEHLTDGLRLSRRGIAEDARHAFPGKTGAEGWARGLKLGALQRMVETIAIREGRPPVFITLRPNSGGQTTPAVVFASPEHAVEIAKRKWPGWEVAT